MKPHRFDLRRSWLADNVKESLSVEERNFSKPLVRFARRAVRDHNAFVKTTTIKRRLSRDFQSRSVFDFFNSIGT